MSTLLLRLAAPLQAWGDDSRFSIRRSYSIPTKSGVIGLLASALGRKRNEENQDLCALHMGVRVDQPGESLEDFQMVHGIKQADLTRRFYLSDAVFLVGLEHPDQAFLEKIQLALENPVYPLFLGRRSCPLSYPLVLGIRQTGLKETLLKEPWLSAEWRQKRLDHHLRLILDDDGEPASIRHRLKDEPVSFNPAYRRYRYRYVKEAGYVDKGDIRATDHDAFGELGGDGK